jgi:ubiquinone/menaquinone biosynthesis C-methylase UbiE
MGLEKDKYIKALQKDKVETTDYYSKSFETKTEQQKFLEEILQLKKFAPSKIADIACGGGSLSYNLSKLYNSEFSLVDLNEDGLTIAKTNLGKSNQFQFITDSIYELKNINANEFDLTFCWQTLSWLDEPEKALEQLVKITKKGGYVYLSSLFNIEHDVDIYAKVIDHTRQSSLESPFSYNTYSQTTLTKWLNKLDIQKFRLIPFSPSIDLFYEGKGIGTYTVNTEEGKRLQISAGMLMNWAILEIQK